MKKKIKTKKKKGRQEKKKGRKEYLCRGEEKR
jgi:hypothetical protein